MAIQRILTITITTDTEGRITGLVVPEGACAQIVPNVDDAFAARYGAEGAEGEQSFRYDESNDTGQRPHIPSYYRSRSGMTVYDVTPVSP